MRQRMWVVGATALGIVVAGLVSTGGPAGAAETGHTSWQMRSIPSDYVAGNRDYSYTPANATFSASGTASFVNVGVDADAWWSGRFAAPEGEAFVEGQTYSGAERFAGVGHAGIDVGGDGRGCNETLGSFTVHQYVIGAGDQIEKLSISFVQQCEKTGPPLYGWITYHADEAAGPLPPRVKIETDATTYQLGQKASVTASLSKDSALRTVSVYAQTAGSSKRLVKRGAVDAAGRLTVKVPVSRRTVFTAVFDGEGEFPDASAKVTVRVGSKVTPTMKRYERRAGKYYVYKTAKRAYILGKVSPNHGGDCLYFRAQFKVGGAWRYPSTTGCVRMVATSKAMAYLAGDPAYVGVPVRMRAEFRGDKDNLRSNSPWRYVKFVR